VKSLPQKNRAIATKLPGTALHVIRDFLGPAVVDAPITDLNDLAQRLAPFRGHNMAKAGLELAFMDLLAQVESDNRYRR
jgi:hypothetical protein